LLALLKSAKSKGRTATSFEHLLSHARGFNIPESMSLQFLWLIHMPKPPDTTEALIHKLPYYL
jgi:hypothetical protein